MDLPDGATPAGTAGRTWLESRGISPAAFGALSILFFFAAYYVVGTAVGLLIFGVNPDLGDPGPFRAVQGISQVVILLLPALLLARLASPEPLEYLRVRRLPVRAILASLAGVLSLQVLLQVYLVFQEMVPVPDALEKLLAPMKESMESMMLNLLRAESFPEFLVVVLVIAVVPAVTEEFAFRGLVQRSFENGLGAVRGFVLTGIIFGAFHLNPFAVVPLMTLGVYLGFVAWRSGSIWVSVTAHFFNNLLPVSVLYFGLADEEVAKGDLGDLPAGELLGVFLFSAVIFLLSTYYFLHVTRQKGDPAAGGADQS